MKRLSVRRVLAAVFPIVLFSAMICWLVLALNNANSAVDQKELENVKNTVENGITMCYAIEGAYPENIEYLKENYGVIYDADKYLVHYDCFADNIRPVVKIIERRGRA